jgi:asparagine synthase (glutamine-hydrolysing)
MLDESVRMQLVSDVPVGVFLSGGIDSSSLVAILHRNGIRANTFSVVFHEANLSEAEYSRAIAKQFHTEHHEINVSQSDLLAAIDPAIAAMDLPTIDGVNTYFVSERTRAAGVKVALSGLGGDEIFAGYASFRAVPRMERFANAISILPARLNTLIGDTFAALSPTNDQNHKVAELLRDGGAHPYFLSRMLFTSDRRHELLGAKNSSHIGFSPDNHSFSEAANRARQLDPINRVSYLEARCYMLNTLLRDSDFMSMAHGLEVRVPLIDHQLARRVLALPGSWKLDGGVPKPLLVKALGVQLPDKIVHRPKRGFTLPFDYWLRDALRPVLEKSLGKLEDGPLSGFIDRRAASHVWQDFLDRKTSWSRPWSLYVLQNWCQRNLAN